jgi:exonuclease III
MKGIFWNIRGLWKSGKKQFLIELIHKYDLDFVGIQETKSEVFTSGFLEVLAGRKQFCRNWLPSKGAIGVIMLGVNSYLFEIDNWLTGDYFISCDVVN